MFKSSNKRISTPIGILIIILVSLLVSGLVIWQSSLISEKSKISEIKIPEKVDGNMEIFIPENWQIIKKTEGDLNKDKLADVVIVIEQEKQNLPLEEVAPRALLIAFQKNNGSYELSIQSDKAILMANEGGIFGDPLEEISVDKGSLLIKFYGGSNWRWQNIYRFRYQDNDWYLIGATFTDYHTISGDGIIEDYNLLTGKMKKITGKIVGPEASRVKEEWFDKGLKELLNLKDFDVRSSEETIKEEATAK